jgi:membrane fusion protein (multidrug efflux system)
VTLRKPPLALAAAASLIAGACSRPQPATARAAASPPALPADVRSVAPLAAAAPSPAAGSAGEAPLALTGEFVSPVRSELVSRLPGRVGKVFVDQGARVRRGQPLLELETDYLRLDLDRARAELERAEAAARDAQRDFTRKQELILKGSVAQAVHDRSQAADEQARAARAAAAAAADLARQRLADSVLVAPIDGVVAERRTDVGERLGDGSVAFVVEQTAPLKLRFRVPERYLARVRAGQAVRAFVDPYPEAPFAGRIAVVGGSIDTATRTLLVEAEFDNRDGRLRPGLFARVEADLGDK